MQGDEQGADAMNTASDRDTDAAIPEPNAPGIGAGSDAKPPEASAAGGEADAPPPPPTPIEHHPDEASIREGIIGVLRTIYDPEIPVNIYDIGLIYSIVVDTKAHAHVRMTLTSPMCPVAGTLPGEVEMKVNGAPGVESADVELVWDPPWGIEKMSEAARMQLNL